MFAHPGNVLADQVDVGNALVCLAVGQQEAPGDGVCPDSQLPIGKRTATIQPACMQRGTTPGMNASEQAAHVPPYLRRHLDAGLQHFDMVIEDRDRDLVTIPQLVDHRQRRRLGSLDLAPAHRTRPIDHDADRHRQPTHLPGAYRSRCHPDLGIQETLATGNRHVGTVGARRHRHQRRRHHCL